jgi:dihydroxy-acid dehydratase
VGAAAGRPLHGDCLTSPASHGRQPARPRDARPRGDPPFDQPLKHKAGFLVLSGNLFDFGIMKTSVISRPSATSAARARACSRPRRGLRGRRRLPRAHQRPGLNIDEGCILVMRGAGPIGWPGSAEVVNMQPPDALIRRGILTLPTLGDGRQSGTADSPSILNVSPESAVGGGLSWLQSGDMLRIDLNAGRCDALVAPGRSSAAAASGPPPRAAQPLALEALYREKTGQLAEGATLDALDFRRIAEHAPQPLILQGLPP